MTPEMIVAVSGLITGVLAAIGLFLVNWRTVKKDEVVLLREEVGRLQTRVKTLEEEKQKLSGDYDAIVESNIKLKEIISNLTIQINRLEEENKKLKEENVTFGNQIIALQKMLERKIRSPRT
jgi:uncharacterized protein (DUF3084 family)